MARGTARSRRSNPVSGAAHIAAWLVLCAPSDTDAASIPTEPAPVEVIGDADPEQNRDSAGSDETVRTVVVQADTDGMTASGRTISRRAIDATPKRSAEDILRLVPGLHIVQHGSQGKGYQFYLRGFDAVHGADIETLVDDIPVNESSNVHAHGYLDLAWIIPEVVDRVDAEKGSLRIDQGNFATAGSIHYRLGVPERGTRASYEAGTTNRHRLSLVYAPATQSKETFLAIEALHDDGFGTNRNARRLSAMGQARLWSRRGTTLSMFGAAYGARFGLPGVVRIDEVNRGDIGVTDSYTDGTHGESDRVVGSLRVETDRGRVRSRTTAYTTGRRLLLDENFTGDLLFEDLGDRHRQHHDAVSPGIRSELTIRLHDRIQMPVVAHWQGDFIAQSVDQVRDDGTLWDTSQRMTIAQHSFGVGTGLRVAPTDWMQLEAGGRIDGFHAQVHDRLEDQRFSGTTYAASPRLMSKFTPGERWQLFAGYGRGLRSPEARAFARADQARADTDLSRFGGGQARVTTSDNVEVGARVQPNRLLDISAAAFGTWIGRESVFDHVSGFNIELSGTRRVGVEGNVQLHPTPWLDVGADVTYAHARFVDSGNPIPGAPPLVVATRATLLHPKGFRAGLRWFLLGPRPLSYGATAGVATVVDLSVGYRYRWFQVDLSIDNVLNQAWREGEYHFASHWDRQSPRSQLPTVHAVAGNPFVARIGVTAHF